MLLNLKQLAARYRLAMHRVVHIGANEGEELPLYRELGVQEIFWAEPRQEAIKKLLTRIESIPPEGKERHIVYPGLVGARHELRTFYHASNEQSSSALEPIDHLTQHPDIRFAKEPVRREVHELHSVLLLNRFGPPYSLLNADVQGMELEVLKGVAQHLDEFQAIYLEVNVRELYRDCAKLWELDDYLTPTHRRLDTVMTDAGWGDALWVSRQHLDSVFRTAK